MVHVLFYVNVWLLYVGEGFVDVVLCVHDHYAAPLVCSFDGDVSVVFEVGDRFCLFGCDVGKWW